MRCGAMALPTYVATSSSNWLVRGVPVIVVAHFPSSPTRNLATGSTQVAARLHVPPQPLAYPLTPSTASVHLRRPSAWPPPPTTPTLQATLRCAAQHFVYSSINGGIMGEDGRYDAFETTLEVLRVKGLYPDAEPSQYQQLDSDFRDFMACQDPKGFKTVGPAPDQYGLMGSGGSSSDDGSSRTGGSSKAGTGTGSSGSVAEGGGGGSGGSAPGNPLCSHALPDRQHNGCEQYLVGSSKTHLLAGGVMCGGVQDNIANCPRVWL